VPLFILSYLAPDSTWWLIRKRLLSDAEKAIKRLSKLSAEEVDLKIAMIVHINNTDKALKTETVYFDCFRSTNLRRTETAYMVLSAQCLSGEAFECSNSYFLTQAGLKSSNAYKVHCGGTAVAFVTTVLLLVRNVVSQTTDYDHRGLSLMTLTLLVIGILA
jgi:MFS transporter, SP family, general alpha glucoside:H+ symporter